MPSAASSGRSDWLQHAVCSSICASARLRIVASCCSVVWPSIETSSMPARNFLRIVATRTMKNSSRLVPVMARNLTRSSSGCDASCACASTRSLNASQLSSRLMIERRAAEVVGIEIRPVLLDRRRRRDGFGRAAFAGAAAHGGGRRRHRLISIPYGCERGSGIGGQGSGIADRVTPELLRNDLQDSARASN